MKDIKRAFRSALFLSVLFSLALLSGCVRIAGGAGYWHTDKDGQTTAKTAGFDSADYIPGSPAPGTITV